MNEQEIVRLIEQDPQSGFRQLLKEYKEPVYWHIRRMTVNCEDAKDATQETFIRVFRALDKFDRSRSFKAWLYRVATNEALRIIGRRHPAVDIENNPQALSLLADEYVDFQDIGAVKLQKAVLSLPLKQKLTFNLRYWDELSFDEIAEITDTTPTGAKANWHNAKVKIQNHLKEYYGQEN